MKTLVAILVVALIWAAGLFAFADRVQRLAPPDPAPQADGIVALTGASDERIEKAAALLQQGKARRLLVSGVNKDVKREELRRVAAVPKDLYDCCVQLDYDSQNTIGNARYIADWAKNQNFKSLIVVTSDYHMPRSMLEIRGAMDQNGLRDVALISYPVPTPSLDARRWWRSGAGARFMTLEYSKYLVVLAREGLIRLGDKKADKPAAAKTAPAAP